MGRRLFATLVSGVLSGLLCLGLPACNQKPDTALCGRYYRHLLELQDRDGHPGVAAGLKTADAKPGIIEHCMQLDRETAECSVQSQSLSDSAACETPATTPDPEQ
jgi:hypothetical protein